jgi:hypothetical protein
MDNLSQAVERRWNKHIGPAKKLIVDASKDILTQTEILDLFKNIVCNIFDFDEQSDLVDLSIVGAPSCYLGIRTQDEIKCVMELVPPSTTLKKGNLKSAIELAVRHHAEFAVRSNAIEWYILRSRCDQPDQYAEVRSFSFLELDLKNENDLESLFLLCKEAQNKTIITDQYNRFRWSGFLSKDKRTIEYMFLLEVYMYEDGSEKVHIPHLNVTYRCDKPFVARRNAERAIERHMKNECGKEYDVDHKFETVAYHKETACIKQDHPVWW